MIPVSYSIYLCISELGATAETCAIGTCAVQAGTCAIHGGTCAIHGRTCTIGLFTPKTASKVLP